MIFKKGAMFGLDARIALAIFGALSVISGAALYSAIQDTQAKALLTEMNEYGKVWEQFYLDTGTYPDPLNSDPTNSNYYILNPSEYTISSTKSGWKGPYIAETEKYQIQWTMVLTDEDWAGWNAGLCTAGKQCYLWIYFSGIESRSVVMQLDEMIDGVSDSTKGNFRYGYADDVHQHRVYLKYAPAKNPHG